MCNSNHVDKEHYQSKARELALAQCTAANYQEGLQLKEQSLVERLTSSKDLPSFDTDQQARELRGKAMVDKQNLEKFFRAEEMRLVRVKPTLKRMTTPKVRKALVDCLIASRHRHISSKGNLVDRFMRGDAVWNKDCASMLLRMLFILPQDLPCVKVVQENLIAFAELSQEEDSMRKLEWEYVWKLLEIIKNIKKNPSGASESSSLLYSLAQLNKAAYEEGDLLGYSFGNHNLRTSIQLMLSQQQARESQHQVAEPAKDAHHFLSVRQAKTLAYIEERRGARQEGAGQEGPAAEPSWEEAGQAGASQAGPAAEPAEPVQGEEGLAEPAALPGGSRAQTPYPVAVQVEEGLAEPAALPVGSQAQALHTPAKQWEGAGKWIWNDEMKIELLRIWIQKTADPMVRASTVTGKSVYMKQLRPLLQQGVGIQIGDERLTLSSLVSGEDTLAQLLQGSQKGKGLSGQRDRAIGQAGLVHIIDEWLENKEEKSKEYVKAHCQDILAFARAHYC